MSKLLISIILFFSSVLHQIQKIPEIKEIDTESILNSQ